jgi:hypothetical protein
MDEEEWVPPWPLAPLREMSQPRGRVAQLAPAKSTWCHAWMVNHLAIRPGQSIFKNYPQVRSQAPWCAQGLAGMGCTSPDIPSLPSSTLPAPGKPSFLILPRNHGGQLALTIAQSHLNVELMIPHPSETE